MVAQSSKKSSFTLLEIVVALSLLSAFAAFVGSRGLDLLHSYQKKGALGRLDGEIDLARHLALNYQSPVYCIFENTSEGLLLSKRCYEASRAPAVYFQAVTSPGLFLLENAEEELVITGEGWLSGEDLLLQYKKEKFIHSIKSACVEHAGSD